MRKLVLGAMALGVALTAVTFTGPAFGARRAGTPGGDTAPDQRVRVARQGHAQRLVVRQPEAGPRRTSSSR